MTEKDILRRLATTPLALPPLVFERDALSQRALDTDGVYRATWGELTHRFVVEVKARATPQAIIAAAHQAKSRTYGRPGVHPLVVVPYLSPSQLDEVESLGISAIDLCGNGVVTIRNELFVLRSGRPNQFRDATPLKGAYRGTSSLVARALLLQPKFDRVSDIQSFISARNGHITLGTVSKSLNRLREDLVIARDGSMVRVLQPDKLLSKLKQSYRPPVIVARWTGKVRVAEHLIHSALVAAAERERATIVLTGLSSAPRYVPFAAEPVLSFYCSVDPRTLLLATQLDTSSSTSFPDLELLQTEDQIVYFDPKKYDEAIVSSPIQVWLELSTGDKRAHEAGMTLQKKILAEMTPRMKN
jgi:hypothetical protein